MCVCVCLCVEYTCHCRIFNLQPNCCHRPFALIMLWHANTYTHILIHMHSCPLQCGPFVAAVVALSPSSSFAHHTLPLCSSLAFIKPFTHPFISSHAYIYSVTLRCIHTAYYVSPLRNCRFDSIPHKIINIRTPHSSAINHFFVIIAKCLLFLRICVFLYMCRTALVLSSFRSSCTVLFMFISKRLI